MRQLPRTELGALGKAAHEEARKSLAPEELERLAESDARVRDTFVSFLEDLGAPVDPATLHPVRFAELGLMAGAFIVRHDGSETLSVNPEFVSTGLGRLGLPAPTLTQESWRRFEHLLMHERFHGDLGRVEVRQSGHVVTLRFGYNVQRFDAFGPFTDAELAALEASAVGSGADLPAGLGEVLEQLLSSHDRGEVGRWIRQSRALLEESGLESFPVFSPMRAFREDRLRFEEAVTEFLAVAAEGLDDPGRHDWIAYHEDCLRLKAVHDALPADLRKEFLRALVQGKQEGSTRRLTEFFRTPPLSVELYNDALLRLDFSAVHDRLTGA